MPEEERLELVSTVEDEFTEPLERLESTLESVDDEIRQTGRGRDHVGIDVEVDSGRAFAELEALDSRLEDIDDDLALDVERQIDDSVAGGELDRRFEEIESELGDESAIAETVEIETAHVDIDAGTVDVDAAVGEGGGVSPDVDTGGDSETIVTNGGFEDDLFTVENIEEWEEAVEPFLDREELGRRGGEADRVGDLLDRDITHVVDFDDAIELAINEDSDIDLNTLQALETPGMGGTLDAIDDLDDAGLTLLGDDDPRKEIRRLKQDIGDLRPTMKGFHNALAAALPILGVFIGAIPAAVVGVGALATAAFGAAAALAGIGGLGAMGVMLSETGELDTTPLTNRLDELTDTFVDAFAPLATSLAPTVEYALSEIEAMAGPLADASAGLLQFRDEFEGVVGFLLTSLPSFTSELLAFTDAAMPLLTDVLEAVSGIDVFGHLASQLERAWPALVLMGTAMVDILPMVVNLSQGFLVVAGAIMTVIGTVAGLMNQFPMLSSAIGATIGVMLTAISVVGLWQIATGGLIAKTAALAATLATHAVAAMQAYAASAWSAMVSTLGLAGALATVLALTGVGIAVIGAAASMFGKFIAKTSQARKELERFASSKNALRGTPAVGGGGGTPTSSATNAYQDHSTTIIYADDRDGAARQQYSSSYEQRQHVDSVFGG
jgi:hypothetical protein